MFRTHAALGALIVLAGTLAGCATPITNAATNNASAVSQVGLRGKQVVVSAVGGCLGNSRLMNPSQTEDVQVPPLVRLDVACSSSTRPAVVKRWALALAGPDDPIDPARACTFSLVYYPIVVGTSVDGSTWLLRVPRGDCGGPSNRAWAQYAHLRDTGHL